MLAWISEKLVGLYRIYIGDVQVTKVYTGFDASDTIYLGFTENLSSKKMHIDVKQMKYIKIYSRWWIKERSTFGYEVNFVVFDDLKVIDSGTESVPQLCSIVFSNTYRPHLLAIDCFLSGYLQRTSRS